jgi:hypothetical protein
MSGVSRAGRIVALGVVVVLCAAGVAVASGWSLRSDLLRSGEQPGYTVIKGSLHIQRTAAGFARSLFPGASPKRLREAGFVEAAEESLRGSHHRFGVSFVARFTNRRAAVELAKGLDELIRNLVRAGHAKHVTFSMPGIASSYGISFRGGEAGAAFLFWVEGDCMFWSGQDRPRGPRLTAKQLASAVITGAESQHARTNGTCPAVAASFTG